jgi:hypothetical protein
VFSRSHLFQRGAQAARLAPVLEVPLQLCQDGNMTNVIALTFQFLEGPMNFSARQGFDGGNRFQDWNAVAAFGIPKTSTILEKPDRHDSWNVRRKEE